VFILFGLSVGSSAQATRSLSWRALSGVPHGRGLWRSHNLGTSTATDGVWTKYQAGDEQDPWQVLFFCYPTLTNSIYCLPDAPVRHPLIFVKTPSVIVPHTTIHIHYPPNHPFTTIGPLLWENLSKKILKELTAQSHEKKGAHLQDGQN